MRILLDTHTLLWAAFDEDSLSPRARRLIQSPDSEIIVSAATAWEITTHRTTPEIFAQHTCAALRTWEDNYLEQQGRVSAMTKAASYCLWNPMFSRIRN